MSPGKPKQDPHTLADWLQLAMAQLSASDSPKLDAELLLSAALEKPRSHIIAWPEKQLDEPARDRFMELLQRRVDGEPIAHILGRREFWSLPLRVTADTLIPRPDTETLVETALEYLPADSRARVLDLGSGSGAIALAIRHERPDCRVIATDASETALAIARQNAKDLGLDVEFRCGSWWEAIGTDECFELIVSNPPYIPATDPHLERGDVRFEPRSALASGADGLDDIRMIVHGAGAHLVAGGWLLLEHGYDQAEAVAGILAATGFESIRQVRDNGGNDRVSGGQWHHNDYA